VFVAISYYRNALWVFLAVIRVFSVTINFNLPLDTRNSDRKIKREKRLLGTLAQTQAVPDVA
jgi:hypothetical protein